eukprot:616728-Pelagomonas_calceolata.AAC.1
MAGETGCLCLPTRGSHPQAWLPLSTLGLARPTEAWKPAIVAAWLDLITYDIALRARSLEGWLTSSRMRIVSLLLAVLLVGRLTLLDHHAAQSLLLHKFPSLFL